MKDGIWTSGLEDDFQQRLQDDLYLQSIREAFRIPSGNRGYIPMWKKICLLRRCFPTDIISEENHLEYGASDLMILPDGTEAPNPVWNRGFCERLSRLALGGPWGGNMSLLALFIRYTTACRLNDRRNVPFIHRTDSTFLDTMSIKLSQTRDATKSIPQIHKEVRQEMIAKGIILPWYSTIMRNIEKRAYSKDYVIQGNGIKKYTLYRVRTEDLRCVEYAVHHCKDLGMPIFTSIGDTARTLSHGRQYDFPKTEADIQYLQERIYVAKKRLGEKRLFTP